MKAIKYFAICLLFIMSLNVLAQEENEKATKEKVASEEKPVRNPWTCGLLIDNRTTLQPYKGSLELIIHHRFSGMQNNLSDLFGIYGASNLKLGLNYGINKKIMVGLSTEKFSKLTSVQWQYAILTQTRSGSMPISVSYYGNTSVDGRSDETFGANYKFANRLSYFNQIIIARKFGKKVSLQVAPSYSHFNSVDSIYSNDKLGIHVGGLCKVFGNMSLIAEYDHPISVKTLQSYQTEAKPNLAFGFDISTSTHSFQLFASSAKNIVFQKNYVYNSDDFTDGGLAIGFNISVRF